MSSDNKTEQPTEKKLRDEYKRGNVAQSREVGTFAGLLVLLLLIATIIPASANAIFRSFIPFMDAPHDIAASTFGDVLAIAHWTIKSVAIAFLLFAATAFALGLLGAIAQGKIVFSQERITPKLHKISPLAGFKRLCSMDNLVEFLKGVAKLAVVIIISSMILIPYFQNADRMSDLPVQSILPTVRTLGIKLLISLLIFSAVIALLDRIYKTHSWKSKIMMTKQEIKDEMKQNDGDPSMKAKRRDKARMMVKHQMMAKVPSATFIVTNPTHFAVALRYEQGVTEAPVCVAKGVDNVALKIREIAGKNNIPIIENPPLARALHKTSELEQVIPFEHFEEVARVVTFVMSLNGRGGTVRMPNVSD